MRKSLVLCLGSGGVRGFVHLGVYKCLYEHGLIPDAIYGCSVGSLVGAMIASQKNPDELIDFALGLSFRDFLDVKFSTNGFIKGEKLRKFVKQNIPYKNLEELPIPLTVLATRARDGMGIYFSRGEMDRIIQASCSIPGVFYPTRIGETEYLDGDLSSPTPILQARKSHGKEAVILGVNLVAKPHLAPRNHWNWARWLARDTYRCTIVNFEKEHADIFLYPDIDYFSKPTPEECRKRIDIGYQTMSDQIPHLKQILVTV